MDYLKTSAKDFPEVERFVNQAMHNLASEFESFGVTVVGDRGTNAKSLENKFQEKLQKHLEKLTSSENGKGWRWIREARVDTDLLTNKRNMKADLLGIDPEGFAVVIELKYVTTAIKGRRYDQPRDVYAFPYDVLKDSVKIEVLLERGLPESEGVTPVFGFSIGLTNFLEYWEVGAKNRKAWSQHYWQFISGTLHETPVPKNIKTEAEDTFRSIFSNRRWHLSFGLPWKASWHDYSKSSEIRQSQLKDRETCESFRYILLRPDGKGFDGNIWMFDYSHSEDDPEYLPFRTEYARKSFYSKKQEYEEGGSKSS